MAEWFDALDDGLKAHVSAQNWHTLDANQAVAAAARAHATALTAAPTLPANALVIPSDPNDAAGWAKVHTALGVPADPKEYKFEGVEGEAAERFRKLASELQVPVATAAKMATLLTEAEATSKSEDLAKKSADRNEQIGKLRQEWAGNYDHNAMIANRTRELVGMTPETFEAIAAVRGFDALQKDLVRIGVRLGEAPFHAGGGNPGTPAQSPQERKAELMGNPDWVVKYLNRDPEATNEMTRINQAITAQKFART